MLIVCGLNGDLEDPIVVATAPGGDIGGHIRAIVGVGKPYYVFASIPFDYAKGFFVTFTGAAICGADDATNRTNVLTMLEAPPVDKIVPASSQGSFQTSGLASVFGHKAAPLPIRERASTRS